MAIHDMWSYDHAPQLGTDISSGTTLSAYSETGTYNLQTGLPGMLYKNTNATGVIGSDGFLKLTTVSGSNSALLIQAKEVQDWSVATKYWLGFRTKTTSQNGAACNVFSISDSLADTNFQAFIQESDMTSAGANTANVEYYVEVMIDRTNLLYEVWINSVKVKNGSIAVAALPSSGNGYYWYGAYNSLSGVTNGSTRCFRDFYFLDVDVTTPSRLGSIKSSLQSVASAAAPNWVGETGTLLGTAVITAAQSKFGGACFTPGSTASSALSIPDGPNVKCLSGDFTIETFCMSTNNAQIGVLFGKDNGSAPYAHLTYNSNQWQWSADSSGAILLASTGVAVNTWMHIAMVLHNGTWTLYQNGVSLGTASGTTYGNNSLPFLIGNYGPLTNQWLGYIDEFRTSNIARYTGAFTPPAAPFTVDANTLMLLHFDTNVNGLVIDSALSASAAFQQAYGTVSANVGIPLMANAPTDDTMTVGFSTSYSSNKNIFAVDFRLAAKTPNSPASLSSSIQQATNTTSFGSYSFSDGSMNYGRRLGLTTKAPDGGVWTPSKISSTSLLITPTS